MTDTSTTPDPTDLAALERDAFVAMTPIERLNYSMQKATLAATREQTAILGAGHRLVTNADAMAPATERVRRTEERRHVIADERREWSALVEITIELSQVKNAPTVTVRARLGGQVPGASEGERAGVHFVSTICDWDVGAAFEAIRLDALEPFLAEIEAAKASGDAAGAGAMLAKIEGRGTILAGQLGARARLWSEVTKPIMQKMIGPSKSLESSLASGACKLVGEIETSTAPLRLEIGEP
jgi:hypothetical protein